MTRADEAQAVARGLVAVLEELAPVVMVRWRKPLTVLSTVMEDWRRVDVVVLGVAAVHGGAPGPALRSSTSSRSASYRRADTCPRRSVLASRSTGSCARWGCSFVTCATATCGCVASPWSFLVDELVSLMFEEIEQLRHPTSKGASRQLPPAALDELSRIPVAQPQAESLIDAHLAVAAAYLPRAWALASRRGVRWPLEMEEATRRYLKRELAVYLPDSRPPPRP